MCQGWVSIDVQWAHDSPKVSGSKNGATVPCKVILGVGVPLHKPEIQLI